MDIGTTAPRRNKNGQRLSRFVFTLNNYTEVEYEALKRYALGTTWFVMGKEIGENGTPHLQGACVIGQQTPFSTLKTSTGLRRAHIEPMRGKPEDSLVYCTKQDSLPFVHGSLPQPGKRTDLKDTLELVAKGATLRDLALNPDVSVQACVVKFNRGLTALRSLRATPRNPETPPKVYWICGETGTGKTRSCFEFGTKIAGDNEVWISSGGLRWFDGYDGQRVAIFDDFRSKGVSFNFFLRLLDRYPLRVEFKGGFVEWNPSHIFITTPDGPRTTFETRMEHRPEDIRQLERRLTGVYIFPDDRDKLATELGVYRGADIEDEPQADVSVDLGELSDHDSVELINID